MNECLFGFQIYTWGPKARLRSLFLSIGADHKDGLLAYLGIEGKERGSGSNNRWF